MSEGMEVGAGHRERKNEGGCMLGSWAALGLVGELGLIARSGVEARWAKGRGSCVASELADSSSRSQLSAPSVGKRRQNGTRSACSASRERRHVPRLLIEQHGNRVPLPSRTPKAPPHSSTPPPPRCHSPAPSPTPPNSGSPICPYRAPWT